MITLRDFRQEVRITFTLAFPLVVGQVGHIMIGVADSVMVGYVGVIPLAAAALANRLFAIIMVLGMGMSFAITPFVAQAIGANQREKCPETLKQGMHVSLLTAVILILLTELTADLIPFLNSSPEVSTQAREYLRILGASVVPFMIFQCFRQFSEGLSRMWPAMILNIIANGVNIFFNWIFIYGHFGFPAMGLNGAGYSTLITRLMMATALVIYVLKTEFYKPYLPRFFPIKFDWREMGKIFSLGLGSGLQYFFEGGVFTAATIMIGWINPQSMAAHQVALNSASVTYMFAAGISAAAAVRVGQAKGEKSNLKMRNAGFSAFTLSAIIMSFWAVVFILFCRIIPRFYISDQGVIDLSAKLLIVAALFQVSDGIQVVGVGALRGMSDVHVPTFFSFIAYWVVGLPAGYILAFPLKMNAAGVWFGLFIGLTVFACFMVYRFYKKTKNTSLTV